MRLSAEATVDYFEHLSHNPTDPNPWLALFYDKSIS
jgi:hypothetical protein